MAIKSSTVLGSSAPGLERRPGEGGEGVALLAVKDLTIDFDVRGGSLRAVEKVSFAVDDAEKVIILGPSGCGKSTVLKAIGGFNPITGGSIELRGAPISKPGPDRLLVFQDSNQLFPWRTVRSNVVYACRMVLGLSKQEARRVADEHLEMVGLDRFADFYPHTLSGGMKQRAAIARALSVDPQLLLMDEPFGALDAQTRTNLQQELNDIWARTHKTIVFVTHSIDEAVRLGSRIIVMGKDPGHIKADMPNPLADLYASDIHAEPAEAADLRRDIRDLLH